MCDSFCTTRRLRIHTATSRCPLKTQVNSSSSPEHLEGTFDAHSQIQLEAEILPPGDRINEIKGDDNVFELLQGILIWSHADALQAMATYLSPSLTMTA